MASPRDAPMIQAWPHQGVAGAQVGIPPSRGVALPGAHCSGAGGWAGWPWPFPGAVATAGWPQLISPGRARGGWGCDGLGDSRGTTTLRPIIRKEKAPTSASSLSPRGRPGSTGQSSSSAGRRGVGLACGRPAPLRPDLLGGNGGLMGASGGGRDGWAGARRWSGGPQILIVTVTVSAGGAVVCSAVIGSLQAAPALSVLASPPPSRRSGHGPEGLCGGLWFPGDRHCRSRSLSPLGAVERRRQRRGSRAVRAPCSADAAAAMLRPVPCLRCDACDVIRSRSGATLLESADPGAGGALERRGRPDARSDGAPLAQ